jgi:hypothetical protein
VYLEVSAEHWAESALLPDAPHCPGCPCYRTVEETYAAAAAAAAALAAFFEVPAGSLVWLPLGDR